MNVEEYEILEDKSILGVLDGDETFGDFEASTIDLKLTMPRLSGPDICNIARMFGATLEYDGTKFRWQYMLDLINYGISSGKVAVILAYLFDESNFSKNITIELSSSEFQKYYKMSVQCALERINSMLHFTGNKIVFNDRLVSLLPTDTTTSELTVKNIYTVDHDYIALLSKRAMEDIENGNYDSALTHARTILEEVFIFVLEKRNIQPNVKGNINCLYKQVKNEYKMHENKDADKRVNQLLSGLGNIVSAIAEMRNKNSDSHGVGGKRLAVDKHYARLAVNSAIVMADFILSVWKKADGENEY